MPETVVITRQSGWSADGDPEPGGVPYEQPVLYIAPLALRRPPEEAGRAEASEGFEVGLPLGCPIKGGDLITVRGLVCRARVKEWRSPFTRRAALVVEATTERG
ncbi:hypothetical protein Srot_1160 [Segniliparus rotundus DSM 44985]|uniref:Head-to-tail stopper n=1 Tax=Segniliparus rotundus (strain ATCC BAA-972 / CDC 1076 / CIP 108378 / DSM 44985 / JCM 13578) TaxID=640132 RepID=D6ZFA8_SEGRD|nr:hypothetical protein [Segniliparus rotundus]ADG97632.1 hypothetical protein Srot_1160 [Segniliparus rotundus DSM 44985]